MVSVRSPYQPATSRVTVTGFVESLRTATRPSVLATVAATDRTRVPL